MADNDERMFLHDLTSPIAAAMLAMDSLLDNLQSRPGTNTEDLEQARAAFDSLEKIRKMLHERRSLLINRGVLSAKAK